MSDNTEKKQFMVDLSGVDVPDGYEIDRYGYAKLHDKFLRTNEGMIDQWNCSRPSSCPYVILKPTAPVLDDELKEALDCVFREHCVGGCNSSKECDCPLIWAKLNTCPVGDIGNFEGSIQWNDAAVKYREDIIAEAARLKQQRMDEENQAKVGKWCFVSESVKLKYNFTYAKIEEYVNGGYIVYSEPDEDPIYVLGAPQDQRRSYGCAEPLTPDQLTALGLEND